VQQEETAASQRGWGSLAAQEYIGMGRRPNAALVAAGKARKMRIDESREPGEAREQNDLTRKTAVILDSLPLRVTALSELAAASARTRPQRDSSLATLTHRELEVLQLVAEGHTNGLMASMLWVTEQTIKFHLSNIYRKLKVSNRTEASRWAQLNGLLPLEPDTDDADASSGEDPEVAAHQVE